MFNSFGHYITIGYNITDDYRKVHGERGRAVFVYQLFRSDLPANFAGYATVSVNKPVHVQALTVAWGAKVKDGIKYSNFPVQADAAVPPTRQISAENLQHALDQVGTSYNIAGVSAAVVV